VLAAVVAVVALADPGFGGGLDWAVPSLGLGLPVAVISGGFLVATLRTRDVGALTDEGDAPLDSRRVRWGMGVALLWALATVYRGDPGIRAGAMLWAVLAAVPIWRAVGGDVREVSQQHDRSRISE
jgi:hypothetical protein